MDVPGVHPSRGTVGTAHGAEAVRSNEWLDDNSPNLEHIGHASAVTRLVRLFIEVVISHVDDDCVAMLFKNGVERRVDIHK